MGVAQNQYIHGKCLKEIIWKGQYQGTGFVLVQQVVSWISCQKIDFGGCVVRVNNFLNGGCDVVKDTVTLELDERAWERDAGKVIISFRSEFFLCVLETGE